MQSSPDSFADDAVEEAEETDTPPSSLSIGGRPLCNLRFADDIVLLGSSEEELQSLTQGLEETAVESDKSKILVNSIKSRQSTNIQMNGRTLEEVGQFKYLCSTQTKDGTSITETKIRRKHTQLWQGCQYCWKTKPSVSHKIYSISIGHLSCRCFSIWM